MENLIWPCNVPIAPAHHPAYGALLGCLIVGILVQLSTLVLPLDLKYLGGLAVLIVILVFRPQGLLGSRARIG